MTTFHIPDKPEVNNLVASLTDIGRYSKMAMRLMSTPRCKALFSDGNTCKKACLRVNPNQKPEVYTDHCSMHGGRQELSRYHRDIARAESISNTDILNDTLLIASGITDRVQAKIDGKPDICIDKLDTLTCIDKIDSKITEQVRLAETEPETPPVVVSDESTSFPLTTLPGGRSPVIASPENFRKENQISQVENKPDNLYVFGDKSLSRSFSRKLTHSNSTTLNEELAVVKAMLQQMLLKVNAKNITGAEWSTINSMIGKIEKLVTSITRLEEKRKSLYTREALRMDIMKVVQAYKETTPEMDRRAKFAERLAKIMGPALADPGDIVMARIEVSRETGAR